MYKIRYCQCYNKITLEYNNTYCSLITEPVYISCWLNVWTAVPIISFTELLKQLTRCRSRQWLRMHTMLLIYGLFTKKMYKHPPPNKTVQSNVDITEFITALSKKHKGNNSFEINTLYVLLQKLHSKQQKDPDSVPFVFVAILQKPLSRPKTSSTNWIHTSHP